MAPFKQHGSHKFLERESEDFHDLTTKNKNPRLLELTSADLRRSEKFKYNENDDTIEKQLMNAKIKTLSRATNVPAADVADELLRVDFGNTHINTNTISIIIQYPIVIQYQ